MSTDEKADPVLVERLRAQLRSAFLTSIQARLINLPMHAQIAEVAFLHGVFAGLSVMLSTEVSQEEGYRRLLALNEAVLGQLEELEGSLVQYGAV